MPTLFWPTERPESNTVLFIYQHRYQRRYYQKLCNSAAFRKHRTVLAFYWTPRLPDLRAPALNDAEVSAISGYQQYKRQQRNQRPLRTLLRQRAHWDYRCWFRLLKKQKPDVLAFWNGNTPGYRAAKLAAQKLGIPSFTFENGPLPNTTTCDSRGINARNSLPRNAEFYRQFSGNDTPIVIQQRPHRSITPAAITLPERYLFAPFQVHEDTQLLAYSPHIPDMPTFFAWLCHVANELDCTIVAKQHPSCKQEYDLEHPNIVFANGNNTTQLIQHSDAVVTVNSTVGLEAIVLNKPVITLGAAFYNVEGIANHAASKEQLVQQLKLVDGWTMDTAARRGFLHFLQQHYLIPGLWREPDEHHCAAVATRLLTEL